MGKKKDAIAYDNETVATLRNLLRKRGLTVSGTKTELVGRLIAHDQDNDNGVDMKEEENEEEEEEVQKVAVVKKEATKEVEEQIDVEELKIKEFKEKCRQMKIDIRPLSTLITKFNATQNEIKKRKLREIEEEEEEEEIEEPKKKQKLPPRREPL